MSKLFLDLKTMKHVGNSKDGKAVFEHKDGHQIHVEPGKLSPKLRGELQAMAKGGKTLTDPTQEHLIPGDAIPNAIEKQVVNGMHKKGFAKGGKATEMLRAKAPSGPMNPKLAESHKSPVAAGANTPRFVQSFTDGGPVDRSKQTVGQAFGNPFGAPEPTPTPKASPTPPTSEEPDNMHRDTVLHPNYAHGGKAHYAGGSDRPISEDDAEVGRISPYDPQAPEPPPSWLEQQLTPGGSLPPHAAPPTPPSQDLQQAASTQPAQSTAPAAEPPPTTDTAQPPGDPNDPYTMYTQGIGEAKTGAEQQQKAESALGKGQEAAYADQSAGIQAQTDLMQQTQQLTKSEMNDYQALQSDVQNNLIDPNHYLHDMSSAGKISTAIGLIAGGIGSGITGQPNVAMQFLNNQIDRDIGAQQHNLGARESLLSANMKHYANMRDAQDMTRIQMQGILAAKMGQAAAQQADPMAKARLLAAKSQIDMTAPQQLWQFSLRRTLMNSMGPNQNPSDTNAAGQQVQMLRMMGNEPMARDLESKIVPGLGVAKVPVPQEVRDRLTGMQAFQEQASKLGQWSLQHSGDLSPSNINYGRALAAATAGAYRQASHGGVYKEGEQQYINGLVDPDPTKFLSSVRVVPKLRAIQDSLAVDQNALHRSVGLPPPVAMQQAQQPQYKMSGGVKYMRGPKGEAIRVK